MVSINKSAKGNNVVFIFLVLIICGFHASAAINTKTYNEFVDLPFDSNWHFHRGDISGAELTDFDDSQWRIIDLPHDWTIEDLPEPQKSTPELSVVDGQWRFAKGDSPAWKAPDFNDTGWQLVSLPDNWENHSNYTDENVYGWFRRKIDIPQEYIGKDFDLLLGCIDDVDEAWLNGVRIGSTGSFPPNYQTAWNIERKYHIHTSLVKGDGTDVLAIRIFDGNGNGGINQAPNPTIQIGPFNPNQSPSKHFTGNTVGGIGWYRKYFTIDSPNKQVSICFDGIYMNPQIWINGKLIGEHPHGYTGFQFDLTPFLNAPGQENVLAVKVRNLGRNSRWYSGSGIYRHVHLAINNHVHIPTWGTFVTTPEISDQKALVNVATEICNKTDNTVNAVIRTDIFDATGKIVASCETAKAIDAHSTNTPECSTKVNKPILWSIDNPYLYTAKTSVIVNNKISDIENTPFGIRNIEFDAVNGFQINGNKTLLKGGCIHHDNGPLGSAAFDRAEYRKIELLKANGYNAIRSSHNPPSSALLQACDLLGMLVIDESFDQWTRPKENNPLDYSNFFKQWHSHDIAAMVRRDRNHPSIIMWSIGNEIPEQFNAEAIQKKLRKDLLSHDTTRPITQAICSDWGSVAANWSELSDPAFKYLDIAGYNYLPQHYESDHDRHPDRIILTTESYPKDIFHYWDLVEKNPYIIGDFIWTAMDYLGEAGIGHSVLSNEQNSFFMPWPWFNAWCGDLDLCGFKKPQSYYHDVVWGRSKIEMAVHDPIPSDTTEIISSWGWPNESLSWNWPGHIDTTLQVSVYSSCDSVRLELNGKTIGEKPVSDATKLTATFNVPYAPGQLRALAIANGKVVAETTLKTTGTPHRIKLTADRSTINADIHTDLCYVSVEVTDKYGNRVPDAEFDINFAVSGVGSLIGHASAVPNKPASFQSNTRETYHGRCIAVIRPTTTPGLITLNATADNLKSASITIQTTSTPVPIYNSP